VNGPCTFLLLFSSCLRSLPRVPQVCPISHQIALGRFPCPSSQDCDGVIVVPGGLSSFVTTFTQTYQIASEITIDASAVTGPVFLNAANNKRHFDGRLLRLAFCYPFPRASALTWSPWPARAVTSSGANLTVINVVFQGGSVSSNLGGVAGGSIQITSGSMYCFSCGFRNNRIATT
jgi:hypothetical protein